MPCPSDMVTVRDFCIDRYEVAMVDAESGERLSPYYPPERRMLEFVYDRWQELASQVGTEQVRRMPLPEVSRLQRTANYTPKAVSEPGVVPHGYLSYYAAKRACEAAGKRLCSEHEWVVACRGQQNTQFPYGDKYRPEPCNVGRVLHPAAVLHGLASSGHLDPRLNLLTVAGDEPVLHVTGASQACASRWGGDAVYDMVGNLDEWVADEAGVFRGGFYARRTTSGCDSQIKNHSATYFDYSTGARCCRDARRAD